MALGALDLLVLGEGAGLVNIGNVVGGRGWEVADGRGRGDGGEGGDEGDDGELHCWLIELGWLVLIELVTCRARRRKALLKC